MCTIIILGEDHLPALHIENSRHNLQEAIDRTFAELEREIISLIFPDPPTIKGNQEFASREGGTFYLFLLHHKSIPFFQANFIAWRSSLLQEHVAFAFHHAEMKMDIVLAFILIVDS